MSGLVNRLITRRGGYCLVSPIPAVGYGVRPGVIPVMAWAGQVRMCLIIEYFVDFTKQNG